MTTNYLVMKPLKKMTSTKTWGFLNKIYGVSCCPQGQLIPITYKIYWHSFCKDGVTNNMTFQICETVVRGLQGLCETTYCVIAAFSLSNVRDL